MSSGESVQKSWQVYQQAVNDLYSVPTGVGDADRSAGEIYLEHLEERSDTLVARSEELREGLVSGLETENLEQRELAALKLLATAAYDLSVASDLMELEKADPTAGVERGARGAVLASEELMSVLDAPLEDGILALLEVDRAVLPNDPQAARAKLQETITDFLKYVPQEAATTSQAAVAGLINLGLGPVQSAASVAVQEVMARIPDGLSIVLRRAARLVIEAIRKLQAAVGQEQEQQVREQVTDWLKDIQEKRDTVTSLLDKLYEVDRIGNETKGLVEAAPDDVEYTRYNRATQTLEEHLGRYRKTGGILNQVMRVLAFVKKPLFGAAPWGPVAIYAAYVGILGYAVYSGGDYLDWYRTGERAWLDRVQGLRTTVRESLASAR